MHTVRSCLACGAMGTGDVGGGGIDPPGLGGTDAHDDDVRATDRLRAAVMVSLGFGARAALASPLSMQTCTDPANSVGSCASTSDCRKICNRLSNGLIPFCDTRTFCCTCQK